MTTAHSARGRARVPHQHTLPCLHRPPHPRPPARQRRPAYPRVHSHNRLRYTVPESAFGHQRDRTRTERSRRRHHRPAAAPSVASGTSAPPRVSPCVKPQPLLRYIVPESAFGHQRDRTRTRHHRQHTPRAAAVPGHAQKDEILVPRVPRARQLRPRPQRLRGRRQTRSTGLALGGVPAAQAVDPRAVHDGGGDPPHTAQRQTVPPTATASGKGGSFVTHHAAQPAPAVRSERGSRGSTAARCHRRHAAQAAGAIAATAAVVDCITTPHPGPPARRRRPACPRVYCHIRSRYTVPESAFGHHHDRTRTRHRRRRTAPSAVRQAPRQGPVPVL